MPEAVISPAQKSRTRFQWWDYPVFATLTIAQLGIIGFIFYRWIIHGVNESRSNYVFLLLISTLLPQLLLWELRWLSLPLMRVPKPIALAAGWRVAVVVTFVPEAESIDMLDKTVQALVDLNYPHDTWVLDEGNNVEVRDLCLRNGAQHFSRLDIPQYQKENGPFKSRTKYGNYNAWLTEHGYDNYDLLVAFDSDHIPSPNYLQEVLGYFADEQVAYVQPAQAYYNQHASFIAAAAAEETYAYYSSIQMISFAVGFPIVVGCHNAHRMTALRQIGGFAPHEADDLVMTLLYRANGWRGVYVPKILARGLTPVDWANYLKQQRRWARSVLDFKFRIFPRYSSRLPVLERILTYLHGFYYLRGPVTAVQIALLLSMLLTNLAPKNSGALFLLHIGAIALTLFACDLYRQRFFLDPRSECGVHWRSAFVGFVKWPYFVLAFADAIRGNYGVYPITSKTGRQASKIVAGLTITHSVVLGLIATAWMINFRHGPAKFVPMHIAAGLTAITCLAAVISSLRSFPPAYQPEMTVSALPSSLLRSRNANANNG